jgi:hypothetical protein
MSTTPIELNEPIAGIEAVELWDEAGGGPDLFGIRGWWVAVVLPVHGPIVIGRVWGSRSTWLARVGGGARVGTVHPDRDGAAEALVARWAADRDAHPEDRDRAEAGL